MSFKKVVENSYQFIIKSVLDRILVFEFDSLLNHIIKIHVQDPPKADETLLITDKFYIYKNIWKAIIETLYDKFLPSIDYEFEWKVELTPYTIMLCNFFNEHSNSNEVEHVKTLLNIIDEDIENDYQSIIKKVGLDKLGLNGYLEEFLPQESIPKTNQEKLSLLFRIMNFPPLEELSIFYGKYNNHINQQLNDLSNIFSGIDVSQAPKLNMSEDLHYSYFHFPHTIIKNNGIDELIANPNLESINKNLTRIKAEAIVRVPEFKDEIICPCCGEKQTIELPEEVIQYKLLLNKKNCSKKIGLAYLNEFTENYRTNLSEKFYSFLPNINKVDNPKCLILVEGESEEVSIPLLAFRKRFVLSHKGIQVYNSKSKQKLKDDFFTFKDKYPNKKIICLLDSDAVKERDDINRVIKDKKDKYRLVFIESGTFEDIFNLDYSIEIINELYPDGEIIVKSDFKEDKDFLYNINKLMFEKKKAQFNKVLFAKTISLKIDIELLPSEINEILIIAEQFTNERKYVKR